MNLIVKLKYLILRIREKRLTNKCSRILSKYSVLRNQVDRISESMSSIERKYGRESEQPGDRRGKG